MGNPTDWVFASPKKHGRTPRVGNMVVADHLRPAAAIPNTEQPERFQECFDVASGNAQPVAAGPVVLEENPDAAVIIPRLVEAAHEFAIAIFQVLAVELWVEVEGAHPRVVARGLRDEPAFSLQALVEPRLRQRGEQADHCSRDSGALDEIELLLEDVTRVAVEPYDETAHDLEAGFLQHLHCRDEIPARVLKLAAFLERGGRGRLYSNEDLAEPRRGHQLAQFGVIGQIDRCLR